jgi:hypothetical protein
MSANVKLFRQYIVEAGLIPHFVSLLLQTHMYTGLAANILVDLAEHSAEYHSQIILQSPPDFLTKLREIPCASKLLVKLSLPFSPPQLLPELHFWNEDELLA